MAAVSRRASVIRDLPIPASPVSRTTWPSPLLACRQRSSSKASSWSRPTIGATPPACRAAKRLSSACSPRTAKAGIGSEMPLSLCGPRSLRTNRSPSRFLVVPAMTTIAGSATACSLAARFGVSPTTACRWAAPSPMRSPTTTRPVAMPMRVSSVLRDGVVSRDAAAVTASPARTARSASSSWALGQPK